MPFSRCARRRWMTLQCTALFLGAGVLSIAGCQQPHSDEPQTRSARMSMAADGGSSTSIRIATFNIQIFGQTKAGKPAIMDQLGDIIRKYDIVAVQEIRDASENAPRKLLDEVNSPADTFYGMVLGPRTGNQSDDMSNREQYAFYFNSQTIERLGPDHLYNDNASDHFQREPFMARFKAKDGSFSFVLISIHTKPEEAVAEIGSLHDVVLAAKGHYTGEDDFLVLGDFNAGCDYASPAALNALTFRGPAYRWIVPDSADTNVSPTKACAYDRMVMTANTDAEYADAFGVDQAFTDSAVSDHWPVWAKFGVSEE